MAALTRGYCRDPIELRETWTAVIAVAPSHEYQPMRVET